MKMQSEQEFVAKLVTMLDSSLAELDSKWYQQLDEARLRAVEQQTEMAELPQQQRHPDFHSYANSLDNPDLLDKKRVLAISKSDLLDDELKQEIRQEIENLPCIFISSVSQYNLMELKDLLWKKLIQ